jgi:hypothetical protein
MFRGSFWPPESSLFTHQESQEWQGITNLRKSSYGIALWMIKDECACFALGTMFPGMKL